MDLHEPIMMTEDEAKQMAQMYNWSGKVRSFEFILLRTFKQYNPTDKKLRLVYEIDSLENINNKYRSSRGKGSSLTEAMQNFSADWSKTSDI